MRAIAVCLAALATFLVQEPAQKGPVLPDVGEAAPEFRLNTHVGVSASIGGESETWTVVAFFPKAATPG
ncbi:MAG: hypothetical protein E2O39_06780 [Planctomycetota bacterium]|nr:MAG: hypothetical protein E2O39_06780 [Planctomycetota bacterium]